MPDLRSDSLSNIINRNGSVVQAYDPSIVRMTSDQSLEIIRQPIPGLTFSPSPTPQPSTIETLSPGQSSSDNLNPALTTPQTVTTTNTVATGFDFFAWMKANPLIVAGLGIGLIVLLSSGKKKKRRK